MVVIAVTLATSVAGGVSILAASTEWSSAAVVTVIATIAAALTAIATLVGARSESESRRFTERGAYEAYASALDAVAALRVLSEQQAPEPGIITIPSDAAKVAMSTARDQALLLATSGALEEAKNVSAQIRKVLVESGHVDWLFFMSMAGNSDGTEGRG